MNRDISECVCLCGHEEGSALGVFYSPCQIQDGPKCFYQPSSSSLLSDTALCGKVCMCVCVFIVCCDCQKGNVQQVDGWSRVCTTQCVLSLFLSLFTFTSPSRLCLLGLTKQATKTILSTRSGLLHKAMTLFLLYRRLVLIIFLKAVKQIIRQKL